MERFLTAVFLIQTITATTTQSQTFAHCDYYNQKLPQDKPAVFARGVISDGFANRDFAISPDGNEILYSIQQRDLISVIMYAHKVKGKWSLPQVAEFSGIYNDLEPAFAANGNRLFFSSNRPLTHSDSTNDYNIWYIDKKNSGWSSPVALGSQVNSTKDEFYPSIAKNGNLYFTTRLESGEGNEDIVVSEWKNGEYLAPVSLPDAINSKSFEFNAFVDPDERFIIFSSFGRNDDLGRGDLYISVKKNGDWQPAVNLGKKINSPSLDYCPFVTWDKKFLFFTSSRTNYKAPFPRKQTGAEIKKNLQGPCNGFDDVYWLRFDDVLKQLEK
jgi:Periplasmic component of the Tol biopolymer transport system